MRSVRVFLPGPVLEGFLKMGYMKMGGWWYGCGRTPHHRPIAQSVSAWAVTQLSRIATWGLGTQGHMCIRNESPS